MRCRSTRPLLRQILEGAVARPVDAGVRRAVRDSPGGGASRVDQPAGAARGTAGSGARHAGAARARRARAGRFMSSASLARLCDRGGVRRRVWPGCSYSRSALAGRGCGRADWLDGVGVAAPPRPAHALARTAVRRLGQLRRSASGRPLPGRVVHTLRFRRRHGRARCSGVWRWRSRWTTVTRGRAR